MLSPRSSGPRNERTCDYAFYTPLASGARVLTARYLIPLQQANLQRSHGPQARGYISYGLALAGFGVAAAPPAGLSADLAGFSGFSFAFLFSAVMISEVKSAVSREKSTTGT